MKKWQENRNYRRLKDKDGRVIANIITVDGMDVEVTDEVYQAYSRADRRERYIAEEVELGRLLSLDRLQEDGILPKSFGQLMENSAEYIALRREAVEDLEILQNALEQLSEKDRALIQALYFDELSTREYARQIGVTHRAVIKRRDRILKDLRNFYENFSF